MSDTSQADASARTRKQVSKRGFLLGNNPVDKIEEADGASYTLLDPNGNHDIVSGELGQPGKFATMCAIFGFHTKVGNVANTILNDKDEPGTPADAKAAIAEFIESANDGTWAERAGGVGAKVDKDALCNAIVTVATAGGKQVDQAAIRQKLEDDPAYVRKARQVPAVATEYSKLVGKSTKTIDDLLAV